MAQAMKRFPIEASAKCKGTRSGVSMTRISSVASVADIKPSLVKLFPPHTHEPSFPNLDQERSIATEINFEIRLRSAFAFNINSALLDHSSRFRHRCNHAELSQQ